MTGGIPERDWRVFRELHPVWIERFCEQVNSEVLSHLSDQRLSAYDRYLKVYKFIAGRDRKLGEAFNDFRRSTALIQIRIIRLLGVIKDEELARFSDSTREFIVAKFWGEA